MLGASWRQSFRLTASLTILIFWLAGCIPFLASAQPSDEAALRILTEKFFAAYKNADMDALMLLWSAKSPDFATSKQNLQQTFAANKIELKNWTIRKIRVEPFKAVVRVVADISALDVKTGKPAVGFGIVNRTLACVKEGDTWLKKSFCLRCCGEHA